MGFAAVGDCGEWRCCWLVARSISGCGPTGSVPVTSVPVIPTPRNLGKIVVVRLSESGEGELVEKDLRDGLKQEGLVEGTSYTLETMNAGGDPARVAGLLEDAVKKGEALVIAPLPRQPASPPRK